MTSIISNFWGDRILADMFTGKLWLALHTGVPPADEVTGGGYTRQPISFHPPSGRAGASADLQLFTGVPMFSSGTTRLAITWLGVWDAARSGNLEFRHKLDETLHPQAPGQLEFAPGEVGITL
jgi:hypothetical protein